LFNERVSINGFMGFFEAFKPLFFYISTPRYIVT
jgi:hypothetical protein